MITEKIKAIAKARLHQGIPVATIAEDLQIPSKLIEEWAGTLSPTDMIKQEATLLAVDRLMTQQSTGELVPFNEELIKNAVEETALEIIKAMAIPVVTGDMVHAKAIQLMADALSKIYHTVVLKGGTIPPASGKGHNSNEMLENFSELMRD